MPQYRQCYRYIYLASHKKCARNSDRKNPVTRLVVGIPYCDIYVTLIANLMH